MYVSVGLWIGAEWAVCGRVCRPFLLDSGPDQRSSQMQPRLVTKRAVCALSPDPWKGPHWGCLSQPAIVSLVKEGPA